MNPTARRLIQIGMLVLIQAVALFGAAWRLNWVEGWVSFEGREDRAAG